MTQSQLFPGEAGAVFSPDRAYRYLLWREWGTGDGTALFCMLNPSTADEHVLDPTLTRCRNFAQAWGFRRMEVVNVFALRSTDPAGLRQVADPVGPENDRYIKEAIARSALVIVGWGAHPMAEGRIGRVIDLARPFPLHCLSVTAAGHPGHPLYLPKAAKPMPWAPKVAT